MNSAWVCTMEGRTLRAIPIMIKTIFVGNSCQDSAKPATLQPPSVYGACNPLHKLRVGTELRVQEVWLQAFLQQALRANDPNCNRRLSPSC